MHETQLKFSSEISVAGWRDYLALMKPRVMSLAVFTAWVGMVVSPGEISLFLALSSLLCIALGAGAAGALNMAYDADIDGLMQRTRLRPVPQGRISRESAWAFGIIMAFMSVTGLAMASTYMAAGLLALSIAFYVFVYTIWLKRKTAQNIVIGGAAGALPPVIGWSVTGAFPGFESWLLFMIIFFWTPPHFWALSLYKKTDYKKAGVPMLPVTQGPLITRLWIVIYSFVLVPLAVLPFFTGLGGRTYLIASVGGGAVFLLLAARLFRSRAGEQVSKNDTGALYAVRAGDKAARDLFAFSIAYLFILFAVLLAEHAWTGGL